MGKIRAFEREAIRYINAQAKQSESKHIAWLAQLCDDLPCNIELLIDHLLSSRVTINFHPDRYSSNGKVVIENLIHDGCYLSQYRTGTTNGGKTAYVGGERFLWEQHLFAGSYPEKALDRPKYGALNILEYEDGASSRFGSCFFTLKHSMLSQCTFSYGDSSTYPNILGTEQSFHGILASLLIDAQRHSKLLNLENYTLNKAVNRILSIGRSNAQLIGRNLDDCIEAHIHGDIMLKSDVDSLHMDESFIGTEFQQYAEMLTDTFNIELRWIPMRQLKIDEIEDEFRGPLIKPLARKIEHLFADQSGVINAALIGKASRSSTIAPSLWTDIGDEDEVFQYIKQLWHTTARYG